LLDDLRTRKLAVLLARAMPAKEVWSSQPSRDLARNR
jgi:hypothetical protein